MKRVLPYIPFLVIALLLWPSAQTAAQSFSVAATSAQNSGEVNGYIPVDIEVTNLTGNALNLRVAITEKNQLPGDWQTQICFFHDCYAPGNDEIDGELGANESEVLDITFITGPTAGSACIEVTITNLDNTSEKQVLTFCATAGMTSRSTLPNANVLSLSQNYPNPFSASKSAATRISYYLPSAQHVALRVYNLLGREVRTIVNDARTAGKSTATWDGRDNDGRPVPPGIYLYKLTTNSQTISRRMIYTR
ncbi:MAG: T9SS type A sorting domain-containing protein [Bacteroidetes bacterium]|nr:T9SS type A sorting domain-containing protein [Bacteroidota bacterium]